MISGRTIAYTATAGHIVSVDPFSSQPAADFSMLRLRKMASTHAPVTGRVTLEGDVVAGAGIGERHVRQIIPLASAYLLSNG